MPKRAPAKIPAVANRRGPKVWRLGSAMTSTSTPKTTATNTSTTTGRDLQPSRTQGNETRRGEPAHLADSIGVIPNRVPDEPVRVSCYHVIHYAPVYWKMYVKPALLPSERAHERNREPWHHPGTSVGCQPTRDRFGKFAKISLTGDKY